MGRVEAILQTIDKVEPQTHRQRSEACHACPKLMASGKCAASRMPVEITTWAAYEACPLGHWPAIKKSQVLEAVPTKDAGAAERFFGIGDAVAVVAHAIGVRKWVGCRCESRRKWLNSWTPKPLGRMLGALLFSRIRRARAKAR